MVADISQEEVIGELKKHKDIFETYHSGISSDYKDPKYQQEVIKRMVEREREEEE